MKSIENRVIAVLAAYFMFPPVGLLLLYLSKEFSVVIKVVLFVVTLAWFVFLLGKVEL